MSEDVSSGGRCSEGGTPPAQERVELERHRPRGAPPASEARPPLAAPTPRGPLAREPARRFDTRRKLFAAFLLLAAAFSAAFASQLVGLRHMEGHLAQLQEHDEQARLTVELEHAIETQLDEQAMFLAGDRSRVAEYREARAHAARLVAELDRRVDEPEVDRWLADIHDTTAELDRLLQGQIATSAAAAAAHDATSTLARRIEADVDKLFAFLRGESMKYHEHLKQQERATLRLGILFLLGTFSFALAVAVYLSRSIARPLAVLGEGAARVASGDLATRIDLPTRDEFGILASKFNAMTSALKEQQEMLVRSEKLASLGRLAAGVAHELNNPLQVMLGYLSLDRHRFRGEIGKHLAAVEREALRCQEIVEGMLQLSRPAIPIIAEPVDLRDVAEDVAGAVRVALGDSHPVIEVEGRGVALGTRGKLRQVIFNLAKNAAEAAGPAGRVRIEVSSAASDARVAVSDTGAGIPPDARARIFEPFYTTKPSGTGLGLPMARAIANALGGDIDVGEGEAGGARFTLRIPRAAQGEA